MKEHIHGAEALAYLPYHDVVFDPFLATEILTPKTKSVFDKNVAYALSQIDQNDPQQQGFFPILNETAHYIRETMQPGGLILVRHDLDALFEAYGNKSFQRIIEMLMKDRFHDIINDKEHTEPASSCVNILLDLQRIIKPEIASFDDGTHSVIEAMRRTKYTISPLLLGGMIDDAKNMRSYNKEFPIDLLADTEGAQQFEDSFKRFASVKERDEFQQGLDIKVEDILFKLYGITLN